MRLLNVFLFAGCAAGLLACSGTHEPSSDQKVGTPVRVAAVLDVPGLVGASIDELTQRLGPRQRVPATFVDPVNLPLVQRGVRLDSLASFRRQDLTLIVAYDERSRRVSDLLLLGTNEDDLMKRAQLQPDATRYLVLPVFQAQQPTKLLGLRVLPVGQP